MTPLGTAALAVLILSMSATAFQIPPQGTAALSGTVTDAVTGQPLAGAVVTLARTTSMPQPLPRMVTDSRGRFVFRNLPAAPNYYLGARRFGYAYTRYGWTAPGGSLATRDILQIGLADGQWLDNVNIPLWRLGSIGGRVVDERNEPVVGVAVRAFSAVPIAGQPQLVAGPLATTDDRGVYRLSSLDPGRYVVSVLSVQSTVLSSTPEAPQMRPVGELDSGGIGGGRGAFVTAPGIDVDGRHRLVITNFATPPPPRAGESRAYPPTFFAGATSATEATAVEIGYGTSRSGIDFQLRPVPAYRVSGRIEGMPGTPPALLLRLMPAGSERLGFGSEAATSVVAADGTFTFFNVPEGSYTILAQASVMDFTSGSSSTRMGDAPGFPAGGISVGSMNGVPGLSFLTRNGQPSPMWGRASVAVGARNLDDVVVTMRPTVTIRGRIVFAEGVKPSPNATHLVTAQPANGDPSLGQPFAATSRTDPTMSFTLGGLMGGVYVLANDFIALGIVSVMSEGRNVMDTGFDASLGRDFDDVVVTLTDKHAEVTGTVRDSRGPVAAAVIAFPIERERWVNYGWSPTRLRSARSGSTGAYQLQSLPEGEYFLDRRGRLQGERVDGPEVPRGRVFSGDAHLDQVGRQEDSGPDAFRGHGQMTARLLLLAGAIGLSATAAAQQLPARDSDVKPTIGTASISGIVVTDEERPQPVRRAIVSLAGAELRPGRGAITDDEGRFTIGALPAGRFTLTVTRSSFVTSVYGAKRPGRPGTAISVADGQRVDGLVVRLWRGAAVAGVVRDDTGAPVEGIGVTAIAARSSNVPGILTLSNNGTTTNDLGEFRIFGLEPGTYVVAARPGAGGPGQILAMADAEVDAALDALRRKPAPGTPGVPPAAAAQAPTQARPFDYAPIYFPGTPTLANATQLTLAPGQEQTGLDFALQRVATSVVSGAVARPDGSPAGGTTLQLTAVVPSGAFSSGSPLVLNATSLPDGTFRINQVTPGEYRLVARASADPRPPAPTPGMVTPGPTGPQLWATTDLSVSGSDVSGLALALEPGFTVAGSVRFVSDSLKPPADLTRVRVALVPPTVIGSKPGTPVTTIAFVPPVNLRADGSFEIAGLLPGTYRLLVNGLDASWWAQSATIGGRDLFDRDVEITRAMSSDRLLVTYSDQRSELSGTLQTPAGAPASDVVVIAFATDRTLWGSGARRVRAARPALDGRFVMPDLPPGDYFLAALADVDQDEWQEPGFLERVIPSALKVSIASGEKKTQNLRLGGG